MRRITKIEPTEPILPKRKRVAAYARVSMETERLMYFLRSMAYGDVFLALATGIRVRSCDLRWNKLAGLFYPVPPITEQENIVKYIDNVINETNFIIADKKKQISTLEDYKKSLIYEYVTGKREVV